MQRNRFASRRESGGVFSGVIVPLLLFVLVLGLFLYGLNSLDRTTQQEQMETARKAIVHATVQCYALEGFYPPSYDYLAEHYGLQVDETKYIIHYNAFATNIMPEIFVFPLY